MTHPPGPANPGTPPWNPANPEPGFYLNQMSPPPPPPKRWPGWKIALLVGALISPAILFALLLPLFESEPESSPTSGIGTPAPYDAAPGQVAPTSAGSKDSSGAKACAAVKAANAANPFEQDPAAAAAIATDGQHSINPFIRGAAKELETAARAVVDARGTADEPIEKIKLGTASIKLETACIEQWYYPPA